MKDAILIWTGAVGAVIAAVCCVTPLLVIALGVFGLAGVTAYLDYVLLPALAVCIGLFSYGLFLRRQAAAGCTPETAETKDLKS